MRLLVQVGWLLAAIVTLCAAAAAHAQDAKLPRAEEILSRMVDSSGGKEAWGRLKNRVTSGRIELLAPQQIHGTVQVFETEPNKTFSTIDWQASGRQEYGTDGEVVWQKDPFVGITVYDGAVRAAMLRQARFNGPIWWQRNYRQVETIGEEVLNGVLHWKVRLTPPAGPTEIWWIDQSTNLVMQTQTTQIVPNGDPIEMTIALEDYRRVDGVQLPFKISHAAGDQRVSITIESIQHNADLPKDRFDLPGDVVAAMRKKPATQPAATAPSRP
jgi:hypothetical protein